MDIPRIAHVSLIVRDTERALRFYREVFDLRVNQARPDLGYPGAWLELDGADLHLLEVPNPDPIAGRPVHGGRDRHTAVFVADLAVLRARLERAGIAYTASRSGRAAIFCRDPDGNAWEIIEHAHP